MADSPRTNPCHNHGFDATKNDFTKQKKEKNAEKTNNHKRKKRKKKPGPAERRETSHEQTHVISVGSRETEIGCGYDKQYPGSSQQRHFKGREAEMTEGGRQPRGQ